MKWTTRKPKEAGFYWYLMPGNELKIAHVIRHGTQLQSCGVPLLIWKTCQWYGPLKIPAFPKGV